MAASSFPYSAVYCVLFSKEFDFTVTLKAVITHFNPIISLFPGSACSTNPNAYVKDTLPLPVRTDTFDPSSEIWNCG